MLGVNKGCPNPVQTFQNDSPVSVDNMQNITGHCAKYYEKPLKESCGASYIFLNSDLFRDILALLIFMCLGPFQATCALFSRILWENINIGLELHIGRHYIKRLCLRWGQKSWSTGLPVAAGEFLWSVGHFGRWPVIVWTAYYIVNIPGKAMKYVIYS